MLKIEEITSAECFKSVEQQWMDLLSKSPLNTFFLTFDWLYNWWNCFGDNKQLKILLVYDNGKLIGIAPFFIHREKYGKLLPFFQIKILGCDEVGSDYLDFITEPGREQQVLELIFNYLNQSIKHWDCIKLSNIPANSKNIRPLTEYSEINNYYLSTRNFNSCPYIALPNSWEDYLSTLSSNMRYNIKRKTKKLKKNHVVEFKLVKEKEQLNNAIDDFIHLNQMRFEDKKIVGAFIMNSFTQFHKQIMPVLFDKGILKLFFLVVDKYPIAGLYIYEYNNKYLYYQAGLDPRWAQFSPGTVLFSYCIKRAIEDKMEEFDFLQGNEIYKYSWTKTKRTNLEIKIFKKSLKNTIIFFIEKQKPKVVRIRKWLLKK